MYIPKKRPVFKSESEMEDYLKQAASELREILGRFYGAPNDAITRQMIKMDIMRMLESYYFLTDFDVRVDLVNKNMMQIQPNNKFTYDLFNKLAILNGSGGR